MNTFAQYFTVFVAGAYFHFGITSLFNWADFMVKRNRIQLTSTDPTMTLANIINNYRADAIFGICMTLALLVVLFVDTRR